MAASVITILPMFGDYYTNTYLTSGSPKTEMVGNQIEGYLLGTASRRPAHPSCSCSWRSCSSSWRTT